ncbi:ABC transporter permease [Metarhizobium album]|uniref:ABC transporter permease n=1 Tax=Metarhizobium album TaxID=2182425 RepID=A0A2U2DKS6_9HYPH|nr:ABC transporter permease [Rhizobium album]PWE53912.1 ABC transporter permease [Rhizobium album]
MSRSAYNPANRLRRYVQTLPAVLVIALLMGLPMVMMGFVSIVERAPDGGVHWGEFTLRAYSNFLFEESLMGGVELNTDYVTIYIRSFVLSGLTVVGTLLIAFPAALFIALQPQERRNFYIFLISIPFWVNLLVRNYAWILLLRTNGLIDQALIGSGIISEPLDLLYTDIAVAIGLIYSFLPLMVMPLYAALEKFDFSLVEAAFDLGANRIKTLFYVIIPGVRPGIVAGSILVFIPGLGAYVTPALLGGSKSMMIGNLIENQFGAARDWPFGAALSFVLLIVVALAASARILFGGKEKHL